MRTPELERALEWARRGDPDGFREIYRALSPTVARVLYALNPTEAEDLASETWIAVAKDLMNFRGDASGLGPWVLAIARNRHRDLCRKAKRRPVPAPLEQDFSSDGDDDPGARLALAAATAEALALVRRLPELQAEVIVLRVLAGLDVGEVARITGQRPGTVRVLAHRGLRTLARHLRENETGPGNNSASGCNGADQPDAVRVL